MGQTINKHKKKKINKLKLLILNSERSKKYIDFKTMFIFFLENTFYGSRNAPSSHLKKSKDRSLALVDTLVKVFFFNFDFFLIMVRKRKCQHFFKCFE